MVTSAIGNLVLRQLKPTDYEPIIRVLDDWFSGEPMVDLLPRLFFDHFHTSSLLIEDAGERVGFLVGFRSQSCPTMAHIHFVGVHPDYRARGIGRLLYHRFFALMREQGVNEIDCLTSPTNYGSIRFHRRMGFTLVQGDTEINGIPILTDFNGPGTRLVVFHRWLRKDEIFEDSLPLTAMASRSSR